MCGICGKVYTDSSKKVDPELIERMCSVIRHRGPDDAGRFMQGNVALGHRRLSILDVTSAGHQPMANEDGTLRIVFNGEIYNFLELRKDLEARGHVFSSNTDTEVIVHLYEEKGMDCLQELQGMFAFALWDGNLQRLFLARDRLGKKPLVYSFQNGALLFASEIKALLQDPGLARDIDRTALINYLTYGYIASPLTVFASIKKLPPAHYLVLERGSVKIERYWRLSFRQKRPYGSVQDSRDRFHELFADAVRIRLRSDVPFGVFLSGGIDSGMIAVMMSRLLDVPVKTFSFGFEEESHNELPFARLVSGRIGSDHHEYVVRSDIVATLPKLMRVYSEPLADPSAVPTYHLSRVTRQAVTVALSGDGGDEGFAGYRRYRQFLEARRYARWAGVIGKGVMRKTADLMPADMSGPGFSSRLRRLLTHLCAVPEEQYLRWITQFDRSLLRKVCADELFSVAEQADPAEYIEALYRASDAEVPLDRILNVDVLSYLPENLMVKTDIAGMASALEVRSPLMDHRIMEFAAALPAELKIKDNVLKYFLKTAAKEMLPAEIINRQKQGFGLPLSNWIREDLKEMTRDLLLDRSSLERGFFKKQGVHKLLDEHMSGQRDHCYRIWNLLCLELWFRAYPDNGGGGVRSAAFGPMSL